MILLVGAGPMATEYAKVLKALKEPFVVVGRGKKSVKLFEETTKIPAARGGIKKWLRNQKDLPSKAIVAVGERDLGKVTAELIKNGIPEILVEKPGGYDSPDIRRVAKLAKQKRVKVYVAYNRRFYASTKKAQEVIKQDGGVKSFNFEFTEWSHRILSLKKAQGVKKQWFLSNSTHVIDLAFFLGGVPKKLVPYTSSPLSWGPRAGIYAGAGITKKGALFSYQANWLAPGRWGVEILTKRRRLIFRPLEKLAIQKIGALSAREILLRDQLDQNYKPGVYQMVRAFLTTKKYLPTIEEQVKNLQFYNLIEGLK